MRKCWCNVFWEICGIIACASLLVLDSFAQSYPVKPIRIVVGFAPGGGTDVAARVVGQKLFEYFGQPVVVENRPGASGSIANERVAKSPPDGYSLVMMSITSTILPALNTRLSYNLERDLAPISLVMVVPTVLTVHPAVAARTTKELIALARSQPDKLSYGSSGIGSFSHLAGELFNLLAKVRTVHVPYKGSGDAVIANAGGQIEMSFPSIPPVLSLLDSGKLRAIAVTGSKRVTLLRQIPTLNESGLNGYDYSNWVGVSTTAGVPKGIIAQLNASISKIVSTSEVKDSFIKQGLEPETNTPEEFAAYIRREISQNARLVKLSGATAD